MLIEFSVDNYKVFNSKQTLSMLAKKSYKEHMETTFVPEKFDDLLINKSAIIYGANGAGKSSFVEALDYLQSYLLFGFATINSNTDDAKRFINRPIPKFRFDPQAKLKPTLFDLHFLSNDGERFHYQLSIGDKNILSEALWSYAKKGSRAKTIISRVYDEELNDFNYYCPALLIDKKTLDVVIDKAKVSLKSPMISILAAYEVEQAENILEWIGSNLIINCNKHDKFFRSTTKVAFLDKLVKNDKSVKSEILSFLKQFDFSITDIIVKRSDFAFPEDIPDQLRDVFMGDVGYRIFVEQTTSSGVKNRINYVNLSSGTKKLFDLSTFFIEFFSSKNSVLVFDEFESSLHPYLVKKVFEIMVKNVEARHQVILTTHSNVLLDTDNLVRRDQIWFLEKNSELETELYPLSDFSPKKEDSIMKGWELGRFGGVPFLD
ncbi:ATP-binding protein [Yersinia enterocolitica]|nr:ATP-binding protein [Yersinia enterocolitica]